MQARDGMSTKSTMIGGRTKVVHSAILRLHPGTKRDPQVPAHQSKVEVSGIRPVPREGTQ
jgi:hypothetical protein